METVGPELDVLIVGGGLVGASLAWALSRDSLRVGIVGSTSAIGPERSNYDDRPIALSLGSRKILEGLNLWSSVSHHTTPIKKVHVSDRGHFGFARLRAVDYRVDALGYVASARLLGRVLSTACSSCDSIMLLGSGDFVGVDFERDFALVRVRTPDGMRTLRTKLLVGADGGCSSVRNVVGIDSRRHDYGQVAVTANVTACQNHHNTAFERFTESGPLALLPLSGNRCGLVWTVEREEAERILALEDGGFLEALHERFGSRLGRFIEVGRRDSHPLALISSQAQIRERLVIAGNAAHTLHPVAGQGFNLCLRDIATLAQVVVDAARVGKDVGAEDTLHNYARMRRVDQLRTAACTHALVKLFSNRLMPLVLARNLGLLTLDLFPPAKRSLAHYTMGLAGRQSRLARALPL